MKLPEPPNELVLKSVQDVADRLQEVSMQVALEVTKRHLRQVALWSAFGGGLLGLAFCEALHWYHNG